MSGAIAETLRGGGEPGAALDLAGAEWAELEAALVREEGDIAAALAAAADSPVQPTGSAVAAAESLTVAVLGPDGAVEAADPQFRTWFGDFADSAAFRRLLARARTEGPTIGLLETLDGGVVPAWAGGEAAAGRWPLPETLRRRLAMSGRTAVVVFAPSRSSALAARAAAALDLSPAEARLAEAMLLSPSLEIAAARAGVGRETARDALKRLTVKTGARSSADLVGRLLDVVVSPQPAAPLDEATLAAVFGLSPAEARIAIRIAAGATAREVGEALGLKPETVRGYAKSVLAKTGAVRAKDLARLLVEARELTSLAAVAEPVFEPPPSGRLRIVPSDDGARRIAFIDYGPSSGDAVFVFHGYAAGRTLPQLFVRRLQSAGLRPIVPQRPGFGLTDPAPGYLDAAADDLGTLVRRLKLRRPRVLARDGGVATALALAARHPGLVADYVLLNPQTPASHARTHGGVTGVVMRRLLGNPRLVRGFAEAMRRHATASVIERNLRQTCSSAADRAVLEDRAVVDGLVRDIQALSARSVEGFATEHALFAEGWSPASVSHGCWTVVRSGDLAPEPDAPWAGLPSLRFVTLERAGLLPQFTHPAELTSLVA